MNSYRVIFPNGNRDKISVALVYDHEVDDWSLASRKEFEDPAPAWEYALDLAKKHNLTIHNYPYQLYLD